VKAIAKWYSGLSNRKRDSISISIAVVGALATLFSVIGFSLATIINSFWYRLFVVALAFICFYILAYVVIGCIYNNHVAFSIRSIPIEISVGDIFSASGFKVIGCDTHFDTRVDDVIVAKSSLHGKLVLEHGKKEEIEDVVAKRASSLGLCKNENGLYDFPLGTVIRYDSSVDNQTYLLLALTEMRFINGQYKAYTSMSNYEQTLRNMWDEIDSIYAYNDIVLPLLGSGVSRFEGGNKKNDALLRCMLCTLDSSGVEYTSKIHIVIYGGLKGLSLYEYKNVFRAIPR